MRIHDLRKTFASFAFGLPCYQVAAVRVPPEGGRIRLTLRYFD